MVLGGQVQSQLLEQCCKSFVKASYLVRTRHAHQVTAAVLHILQPSFLVWSLSLIMLSARNSDKHRWRLNNRSLNTGLLFLVYTSVSFGFCIQFVACNVRLNVCPGVLLWTMRTMRCQTFSSLGFFCRGAFVVWKTK